MFKKEDGNKTTVEKLDFIISSESVITGDIKTKSNICVDGEVKGNIITIGNVSVGSNAKADGNISGKDIQITGTVNGNINATGELMLYPSAKLTGNIKATGIRIEKNAKYEGVISIGIDDFKESAKLVKPDTTKAVSK